ncbi:PucR family transcriptional regulator [Microbacterium hatanonis]|jgi:sugar diacid utilization regulator|uniref:PucR family transcriptional regulator n=1 Tax=Microbacterium hatanonis TaxID=404366 RepID=A0A5C8HWE0_9MICO|nr:PucR family transcriptional regulator [Microbacterium hatanonis]TXK10399.1 PucR family transcriptional regulator [Microbacterium hatanonis]
MAQFSVRDLLAERERLGLDLAAGPPSGTDIEFVDIATLDTLDALAAGTLAIIPGEENPAPYRLDVALRRASARGLAGLVFTTDLALAETAVALAERGRVPVLAAPHAKPSDLAVAIDRLLSGGASEAMTRAAYAIEQATAAAAGADGSVDDILEAAGRALGVPLSLEDDPTVLWSDNDAVCVGEVPIGRLVAHRTDAAADVARPVVASLLSRAMQRQMRDRYAPTQSRADLLVELVLAESSRVEAFVGQAARLGFPLQLSHVAGWLKPTALGDPDARPPRGVEPALELFALQLVEGRDEMWHVAFIQDDMLLVSTEEHGAGDHQRRLREVGIRLQQQARRLAGPGWAYTLGLGTPQLGAIGLRQSAAEARIAADSAVASGRPGGVELTDVTGLQRVLLDFYASPISRSLLHDVLAPLDALGAERATTSVRTLLAYLAHRNSLASAGRELNLHPNAVGYRLKRIREVLQLDLDDPDIRFSVELACRVRLLGGSR